MNCTNKYITFNYLKITIGWRTLFIIGNVTYFSEYTNEFIFLEKKSFFFNQNNNNNNNQK